MAGVEGDDFRSLLDDLVPSSERPERLEPPFPGSERLWGYADRAVVRADRIDAPARLAQQLGPARPRGRVSVSLTEGLVVGSQRLVVLVRRPEDVPAEPPRIRVVRVQLDHAAETPDRPLRLSPGEGGGALSPPGFLGLRVDPQGSKGSSVASQGVRRRGLGGLDPTDPQKPRPDRRIGFLKILDSRPRLLRSEDLERLDERDRCAAVRVHLERRKTGLRESVRFVEHSSFSVEETLEEGHPYHPIPRGAVNSGPRRTSGRHGKWMTYRYRQRPRAVDNRQFVNARCVVTIALSTRDMNSD